MAAAAVVADGVGVARAAAAAWAAAIAAWAGVGRLVTVRKAKSKATLLSVSSKAALMVCTPPWASSTPSRRRSRLRRHNRPRPAAGVAPHVDSSGVPAVAGKARSRDQRRREGGCRGARATAAWDTREGSG